VLQAVTNKAITPIPTIPFFIPILIIFRKG
jgi:hypothetical protein